MNNEAPELTVGRLKSWLKNLPDETELIFQGGMTFYRIKTRGENLEQIEFYEEIEIISR